MSQEDAERPLDLNKVITLDNYVAEVLYFENKDHGSVACRFFDADAANLDNRYPANQYLIRAMHGAMGLCTELGEICEDCVHSLEELGDLCWYTALVGDAYHLTMRDIFALEENPDMPMSLADPAELAEAVGAIMDVVKRAVFYGTALSDEKATERVTKNLRLVAKWVTDYAAWCLGDASTTLDEEKKHTVEEILTANYRKLATRYNGKKFSAENAVKRDTVQEIKNLENK